MSPAGYTRAQTVSGDNRTSLVSQLPTYIKGDTYRTAIGKEPRRLLVCEVTCARRECGGTFIVPVTKWWATGRHKAASCPFCQKTGWRGEAPL